MQFESDILLCVYICLCVIIIVLLNKAASVIVHRA